MAGPLAALLPYVRIARVDHWFKNSFMLLGVVLAFFYQPELMGWPSVVPLALALLATCLVASSNYVLNELLDAPQDRMHPVKRHRPGAVGPGATGDCLRRVDRRWRWWGWAWPGRSTSRSSGRRCGSG